MPAPVPQPAGHVEYWYADAEEKAETAVISGSEEDDNRAEKKLSMPDKIYVSSPGTLYASFTMTTFYTGFRTKGRSFDSNVKACMVYIGNVAICQTNY